MQSRSWINLLCAIPTEKHATLVLSTTNGIEIAIQSIVRSDEDYLVIRGRLTGTMDGGGIFILPFERINYLGFQKNVTEADVREMLSIPVEETKPAKDEATAAPEEPAQLVKPEQSAPQSNGVSTSAPTPPPGKTPGSRSGEGNGASGRNGGVDKASLLERLRTRRVAGENPRVGSP